MKYRVRITQEWSCDYDVDVYDVETSLTREQLIEKLDEMDRWLLDHTEEVSHTAESLFYFLLCRKTIDSSKFVCGISETKNPDLLIVGDEDIGYVMF